MIGLGKSKRSGVRAGIKSIDQGGWNMQKIINITGMACGGCASKVKKTRKPIVLEPMNPYERRIIHSCLQNDRNVVTSSEGEEPYRHVVISLKRYNKEKKTEKTPEEE